MDAKTPSKKDVTLNASDDVLAAAKVLYDQEVAREREKHKQKSSKVGEDRDTHLTPRVQYGYSSYTFPPDQRRNSLATPHHLGERDSDPEDKSAFTQDCDREYQHYRDKMSRGINALVQMHRDRDREQARQSEREHYMERRFDPEADKVKAGKDDEIDVVLELEKDWEKSQKVTFILLEDCVCR